jgi:hypothetical protein
MRGENDRNTCRNQERHGAQDGRTKSDAEAHARRRGPEYRLGTTRASLSPVTIVSPSGLSGDGIPAH